jgi:hypothetical protein
VKAFRNGGFFFYSHHCNGKELFSLIYCTCRKYNNMKKTLFLFLTLFAAVFVFFSFKNKRTIASDIDFEPITVIELFTSQGCSSCPSADRLLSQTIFEAAEQHKKVYALSFHVDYWNRLGWADPFSSKQFSERQANYVDVFNINGAYTPQMVVNGVNQFTGSDKGALNKYIAATQNTKATIHFKTLQATHKENNSIEIKYALEGDIKACKINVALVSAKETTFIPRGENEGVTLTNENVVLGFTTKIAIAEDVISINTKNISAQSKMAVIAYIQEQNNYTIIGAAAASLK